MVNNAVEATRVYDAFGNVDSFTGTWNGPFGYAGGFGYQEDPDHGLKLLGHRYYDSTTGRFISRDFIEAGRNRYAYCDNNPLSYMDPDGLKKKLVVIKGDLGGRSDVTDIRNWGYILGYLYDKYGAEYDIVIKSPTNIEELHHALTHADAAVLVGHGGPFYLPHGGILDPNEIRDIGASRRRLGKAQLDFVMVFSCGSANTSYVTAWLGIADHFYGFSGDCYPTSRKPLRGGGWYDRPGKRPVRTPTSLAPKPTRYE